MSKPSHARGFNLIELMVVVLIIGILSAIAVPSYQQYVIRSSRTAAQTELLIMASTQEKIYLNSNQFTSSVINLYNGQSSGGLGRASGKSEDGMYAFTISHDLNLQTYTLIATPVAGVRQAGDGCLTIQENGLRLWHEKNDLCNAASPTSW